MTCVWKILATALLVMTTPLALLAQPRPGAFTTVQTTNTGANSVSVGCTVGSTTCTGGIDAGSLALSSTGAAAIDVDGGITAGSGNVAVIGTDGRIPSIASTYFADLSGANITGVARPASTETISAVWTFTANPVISSTLPILSLRDTDAAADTKNWLVLANAGTLQLSTATDASPTGIVGTAFSVLRSGTTVQSVTFGTAIAYTATASPAALANGNNNNYNPTSLSSSAYVILIADAGGSNLTGLTAQPAGTEITLCEPTTTAGSLTIVNESASSTAANRFNLGAGGNITLNKDSSGGVAGPCATFWYYGAGARWLLKSTSTSVP